MKTDMDGTNALNTSKTTELFISTLLNKTCSVTLRIKKAYLGCT